jgi:nitric oxide reductase NorE protein
MREFVMNTSPQTNVEPWEPPGGVLVWLLVFLEVITFGAGIITFLVQGRDHPAEYAAGRELLNQPLAFANTLLLLTGGWCMANGLGSLRCGNQGKSLRWVTAAIMTGLVFTLLKGIEYADKVQHDIGFGRDVFFTFYYALTGFHLVHVLAAVVLLAFMARGIRRGHYHQKEHLDVESSGIFWHMCDLIWLLVYPVIYLL